MLQLGQNTEGYITLKRSDDFPDSGWDALSDAFFAFTVVERTPTAVVLDVGAKTSEAVSYLQYVASEAGVEVQLDATLGSLVESYEQEQLLVSEISKRGAPEISEADPLHVPELSEDIELLPHQIRGVQRAITVQNLAEYSVQGAGKTLIALAAFAIWRAANQVARLLVIGPVSAFQPWEEEISVAFSSFTTLRWSGAASERMNLVPAFQQSDVVMCSYDTARRDVDMLSRLIRATRTMLVLDESHYIKNFNVGARGEAVLRLAPHATKRMILTGTPTPHSLLDLWTQISFLWPSGVQQLIGSPQQYMNLLGAVREPAKELRKRLGPFFHRTTQTELGLPKATTHFVRLDRVDVPASQARIIRLLENRVAAQARAELPNFKDRSLLARWQRARIIRLLQAASNPGLLLTQRSYQLDSADDFDVGELASGVASFQSGEELPAKIRWTVDKTRELVADGRKVLIWTWWVDNLHLLRGLLSDLNPLLLYGQIKPYEEQAQDSEDESREKNIRLFKTDQAYPLLIANPAACAEAISLHQVCHDAIYVDRTFNCGQFLQSLNRIHRVGLPSGTKTNYWIPIVDCAVERAVDTRLVRRQETMYDFLGDDSEIFGVDWTEETEVADSDTEAGEAFNETLREIERPQSNDPPTSSS